MENTERKFEEKLLALETLVRRMESGNMSLDDTLHAYEDGIRLSKELERDLDRAEKRMQELADGSAREMEDAP